MIRLYTLPLFLCLATSALAQVQVDLSRYPDGQVVPPNQVISNEWQEVGVLFEARASNEPVAAQGTVWPFIGGAGVDCPRYYFFTPDVFGAVGIFRFVEPGTNTPVDAVHFEMVAGWQAGETIDVVGFDQNGNVTAQQNFVAPPCGGFCDGLVWLAGQFHVVEVRTQGNPGIGFQNCGIGGGFGLRFETVLGSSYCTPAFSNSTGLPGQVSATGSYFALDNDMTLSATQLPAGQFGYFLAGQTQGSATPPGSQGLLCLSGNIGRFNAQIIQGPAGSIQVDLTSIPVNPVTAVQPGETWNFQCWYRDNNPGPTSNFTDAVSVVFH